MSINFRIKGQRDRMISETSTIDFSYGNLENVNSLNVIEPIQQNGAVLVPNGVIVMWSGVSAPAGWALCDGTNGTPDLRGRFILSAGSGSGLTSRIVGQTGGEETHTLTTNEMPVHSHGITDPGHNHTWNRGTEGDDSGSGGSYSEYTNAPGSSTTVIASATTGITVNNAGNGEAHNNMPPYYVLAYIMKL